MLHITPQMIKIAPAVLIHGVTWDICLSSSTMGLNLMLLIYRRKDRHTELCYVQVMNNVFLLYVAAQRNKRTWHAIRLRDWAHFSSPQTRIWGLVTPHYLDDLRSQMPHGCSHCSQFFPLSFRPSVSSVHSATIRTEGGHTGGWTNLLLPFLATCRHHVVGDITAVVVGGCQQTEH